MTFHDYRDGSWMDEANCIGDDAPHPDTWFPPRDKEKYLELKEKYYREFLIKILKSNGVEKIQLTGLNENKQNINFVLDNFTI
jgi:hypothetical protein